MSSQTSNVPELPSRWVWAARVIWLLLTVIFLSFFLGGLSIHYGHLSQTCVESVCFPMTLHPSEADLLGNMGLSLKAYAIFLLMVDTIMTAGWLALAILFFWKKFTDRIGIFMAFMFIFTGLGIMSLTFNSFFLERIPYSYFIQAFFGLPMIIMFYIFPNGRFVPKWSNYFLLLLLLAPILNFTIAPTTDFPNLRQFLRTPIVSWFSGALIWIIILSGPFSQLYRYRFASTNVEKKQLKWAIFGLLALAASSIISYPFLYNNFEPSLLRLFSYTVFMPLTYLCLIFFPISLVIAIMRHNLFDIDVLIRRTLIYGLLSTILAVLYFGMIILAQNAFRAITGQSSQLIVVLSTLAIAALFTPLRKGIQNLIDRRFYRRKYDTEKVLAEFALKARDEVELDALTKELTQVVKDTMQPAHLSLWLKEERR